MQAKGRWGKVGEGVGPLGGELKLRRLERSRRRRRKRKGRGQGTTRETAGEKLESLFSVLYACIELGFPIPRASFHHRRKQAPISLALKRMAARRRHWRIGGGTRRRQPHAAEFSEKGLVVDIVTGLIAAGAPPPTRGAGCCCYAACLA